MLLHVPKVTRRAVWLDSAQQLQVLSGAVQDPSPPLLCSTKYMRPTYHGCVSGVLSGFTSTYIVSVAVHVRRQPARSPGASDM